MTNKQITKRQVELLLDFLEGGRLTANQLAKLIHVNTKRIKYLMTSLTALNKIEFVREGSQTFWMLSSKKRKKPTVVEYKPNFNQTLTQKWV